MHVCVCPPFPLSLHYLSSRSHLPLLISSESQDRVPGYIVGGRVLGLRGRPCLKLLRVTQPLAYTHKKKVLDNAASELGGS